MIGLDYIQTSIKVTNDMANRLSGLDEKPILPFEEIDYVCKEQQGPNVKTLVTFPPGLLNQIVIFAAKHRVPYTEMVRHALEYYYRQVKDRKDTDEAVNDLIIEAFIEVQKQAMERRKAYLAGLKKDKDDANH